MGQPNNRQNNRRDDNRKVAFIAVAMKSKGIEIKGTWNDEQGRPFDLGYAVLPTGTGIRNAIAVIIDQLEATLKGYGKERQRDPSSSG